MVVVLLGAADVVRVASVWLWHLEDLIRMAGRPNPADRCLSLVGGPTGRPALLRRRWRVAVLQPTPAGSPGHARDY